MDNPADEIKAMNDVFEGIIESIDSNSEATPEEVEPTVETEEVEPVVDEEAEVKDVEPTAEPEPEPVVDDKDAIIAELRAKLAEKEVVKQPTAPTTETPFTLEEKDFLGDTDVSELIDNDPKAFNKLLNKIYHQAVTDTRKVLGEGILRSIPDIVKSNLVAMTNLQKASDEFYAGNKDLVPFKKVVATVFEEKASENPDKSYTELLSVIGPEVRKRLGLRKVVDTKSSNAPKLPKRGSRPSRPTERPPIDPLQSEIEEMNKTLWR